MSRVEIKSKENNHPILMHGIFFRFSFSHRFVVAMIPENFGQRKARTFFETRKVSFSKCFLKNKVSNQFVFQWIQIREMRKYPLFQEINQRNEIFNRNYWIYFFPSNLHRNWSHCLWWDCKFKNDSLLFNFWHVADHIISDIQVFFSINANCCSNGNGKRKRASKFNRMETNSIMENGTKTEKQSIGKVYIFRLWWKCSKMISINIQWDFGGTRERKKTIKSSKMKQTVLLRKQINNNACFMFTVQRLGPGFGVFNAPCWMHQYRLMGFQFSAEVLSHWTKVSFFICSAITNCNALDVTNVLFFPSFFFSSCIVSIFSTFQLQ